MPLLLYRDALYYLHAPPSGFHLENPGRLEAAYRGLMEAGLGAWIVERPAPRDPGAIRGVLSVHDESYVRLVEKLSRRGGGMLDPDTYVNEYTFDAALAVVSAALEAALEAARGGGPALVLGRPPGHHAGRYGAAMGAPTLGFCIFNATAAAAKMLADMGLRVWVIDFDLHHGNGTQEILYDDPRIVHIDLHQDPSTIYPGTGWTWQTGEGEARGTKLNVPLPPGSGDDVYTYAAWYTAELAAELHGKPDVVLVDAGFDAYMGDGLGAMYASTATYREMARLVKWASARTATVLEGGYSRGLRKGLPVYTAELAGAPLAADIDEETRSASEVWREVEDTLRSLCREAGGAGC